MADDEGTTINDLMLAACKNDQDEMLEDIFAEGDFDINYIDGLGDSALHYSARFGSLCCLELLLKVPGIQLNLKNKKEGNTPLHLAVQYTEDPDVALSMVDALIDAGADPRIQNNAKQTVYDYTLGRDDIMKDLIDRALAGYDMHDSDDDEVFENVTFK